MRTKVDYSSPRKRSLKLILKTKPKTKPSAYTIENILKKSNDSRKRALNKLSLLDTWLQTLYKPQSQANQIVQRTDIPVEQSVRLIVKLEKLDLTQLQATMQNPKIKRGQLESNKNKKRLKSNGLEYTDRSSEYTKLENKQYKCSKCDYTHNTLISMRSHFDRVHNKKVYRCNLCPFKSTQEYYFNNHVKYHSRPDMECRYCRKMIKCFSYKMHMKTHERNNQTEYKCDFCPYQSYNHANVKRHTLSVHKNPYDLETFSCDSCNYTTILEERLKHHKKLVHSKEGTWLTCPNCDYTTRNKSHMNRHINDVHQEKSVECTECSQLFSSKENLKYHIQRRHTDPSGKRYFYCEMCPKEQQYKTTEKGNLARHILAHRTLDEIEVFACHRCPYLGKCKNALKHHFLNAHLPELHDFKCKICGYSTSTKSRFNHHLRDVHGKPSDKLQKQKKTVVRPIKKSMRDNVVRSDEQGTASDWATNVGTNAIGVKEEIGDVHESAGGIDDAKKEQPNLTDFWPKLDCQQS